MQEAWTLGMHLHQASGLSSQYEAANVPDSQHSRLTAPAPREKLGQAKSSFPTGTYNVLSRGITICYEEFQVMLDVLGPEVCHSCLQMISQTYSSRQDIGDLPLQDPEKLWKT